MIDIAYSITILDYYGKERVEEGGGREVMAVFVYLF